MQDSHEILNLEKAFVSPLVLNVFEDVNLSDDTKGLIGSMLTQDFEDVLKLNTAILDSIDCASIHSSIIDAVKSLLESNDFSTSIQLQVFCFGISSLQLFVQSNWLGGSEKDVWNNPGKYKSISEASRHTLILDGESLFPTTKNLPYLLFAKCVLCDLRDKFTCFKLSNWWLLRYATVHQKVLEEPSRILNSIFQEDTEFNSIEKSLSASWGLSVLLHMEVAHFHLLYGEVQKAKEHFQKASDLAEFTVEWQGALGKRTYFQQKALAQLTIRVHGAKQVELPTNREHIPHLPLDVKLDDDTRLNQIVFSNEENNIIPDLHPLHQALLVGTLTKLEKSTAKDELLAEELLPLVNCILSHPKVWSLHVSSLVMRSRLECDSRRTVERSMMQLQELVDALKKDEPKLQIRMDYFYVSRLPSEWQLEELLADLLLSLGCVNSALDIYLRMEMWEKVIRCYQLLEMRHKAEEVVRQELQKEATPKLWCLLGNCTDDVECYQTAWELSKHKSARAQRDWGYYFYRKKQFKECIPHFQKSLQVNSLQEEIWLRLAFSAVEVEDWETAAGAYRRYCGLNSDSFEAWNNIAKCYIKLGQKVRAWRALQEAVKCNFENWKVWDNLMVVSTDCGEFEEVIRSYHRILDLKEKHVDAEVLRILVQVILENKEDSSGQPSGRLCAAAHKLFGRLTAQVHNDAHVWESYADLMKTSVTEQRSENLFRIAQTMQKSFRSAVQDSGWEKDLEKCISTLKVCDKYVESCLASLQDGCTKEIVPLASSAKMSLRSTISLVRRCYEAEFPPEVLHLLDTLESKLSTITEAISNFPK